jgi:hypothetical protein
VRQKPFVTQANHASRRAIHHHLRTWQMAGRSAAAPPAEARSALGPAPGDGAGVLCCRRYRRALRTCAAHANDHMKCTGTIILQQLMQQMTRHLHRQSDMQLVTSTQATQTI